MQCTAISLFSGAGGMDVGFERAGVQVIWANEFDPTAAKTYKKNHPHVSLAVGDIRNEKETLQKTISTKVDMVFGGPPCQGFSVAGKMNPEDERSKLIWEYIDVVEMVRPKCFVIENVKALGQLSRWKDVRELILARAKELGYTCFYRVLNAADFGVPQKRERVFFVGLSGEQTNAEAIFDNAIERQKKPPVSIREALKKLPKAGDAGNPLTCTAKITCAEKPVLRKSPYAGMLFNGMGRPLDLNSQANTLPASMGGNKTPIIDEKLLHDPKAEDWIVDHHIQLLSGKQSSKNCNVPSILRRITIKEAAVLQTFPDDYSFEGEKSAVYRQIGNAVPCDLAEAVARATLELIQM